MRLMTWTMILAVLGCSHTPENIPESRPACENQVIYRVTASAYPEVNQTVVAKMFDTKECVLLTAPVQDNADDPEHYSWEAYRFASDMKTGSSQSTYIGRAFLIDKSHLAIRLNPETKSLASDVNFLPYDPGNRVILLFMEKGLRTLTKTDLEEILGRSQTPNEVLIKKVKFVATPIETGIHWFNAAGERAEK